MEAAKKVDEFKILFNKAQRRVKEVRGELAMLRATLTDIEGVMNSMARELKQKNRELSTSEGVVKKKVSKLDALKAKIAALKTTNARIKKVCVNLSSKLLKVYLF